MSSAVLSPPGRANACPHQQDTGPQSASSLGEIARVFLRLGSISFGGPAAHIALMREEFVRKRRWMDDGRFLDLLGITNLIPGPNSTEMAIHLGRVRGGRRGLVVAGLCFLLPSVVLTWILAWAYVRYGTRAEAGWLLDGIRPVVLALVAHALVGLVPRACRTWTLVAIGVASLVAALLRVHELLVLFTGGIVALLASGVRRSGSRAASCMLVPLAVQSSAGAAAASMSTTAIGWIFLKTGALLYGSGYVLIAFLRADLVQRLGWLDERQLTDAVAASQATPGPLFSAATFLGYLLDGPPGALVATIAIFLPAFVLVALSGPLLERTQTSSSVTVLLGGINVASLALMASVLPGLAQSSLAGVPEIACAVIALLLLVFTRVGSHWLLAGGALWGWIGHAA